MSNYNSEELPTTSTSDQAQSTNNNQARNANKKGGHSYKNNRNQNYHREDNYNNSNRQYDDYDYYEENSTQNSKNPRPSNNNRSYQKSRAANRNNQHNNNNNYQEYEDQSQSGSKNRQPKPQTAKQDRSPDENAQKTSTRRKLISMSSSTGINCICCLHELYTFVYYTCLHYVCLNCAVKMRVLCEKTDCPVCRQDSKEVYCSKKEIEYKSIEEAIKKCPKPPPLMEKANSSVYFREEVIGDELADILANKCDICTDGSSFNSFAELDSHMRKSHRRFYCELCLEHLKLFPYERKHYNREELAFHKRNGDKDDLSFKGHPRCEYCDQRFFDRDELYRHCRREHYYCHFCDTDGHEEYYKDYPQLRSHFLKSHYLCELDGCSANAAETHEYVVFRSDLDFQAHKKQKHAKSKSDAKNLSKLNLEFNYGGSQNRERYSAQNRNRRGNARANQESDNEEFGSDRTANIDPAVVRMSEEQFERDERERRRKAHVEQMKEQLKNYEQTMKQSTLTEKPAEQPTPASAAAATAAKVEPVEEFPAPQAQSTWRNIIGVPAAARLNKEIDFPTLGADSSAPGLSLAALGASISGSKPIVSAWSKTTPQKQPSKKEAPKPKSEFVSSLETSKPAVEESFVKLEGKKSQLIDEEFVESKKNKKNKKKQEPKPEIKEPKLEIKEPIVEKVDTLIPPPGFSNNSAKAKPANEPPPGFSIQKEATDTVVFIKPENYDERNQELTSKLFLLFGHYNQKEFERFKANSIEFRLGKTNAKDYLCACQALLDLPESPEAYSSKKSQENRNLHMKFLELIQEMIVLLPDVKKQTELHDAYMEVVELYGFNLSDSSGSNWIDKTKSAKNQAASNTILNKLKKCNFCDQYFLNTEYNFHQSSEHVKQLGELASMMKKLEMSSNNDDFPSLGSKPTPAPTKWEAAKKEAVIKNDDFPSLSSKPAQAQQKKETVKSIVKEEEFPSLSSSLPIPPSENRFSALPTPSLFSNPSSHLSLVNKKKHRLQK